MPSARYLLGLFSAWSIVAPPVWFYEGLGQSLLLGRWERGYRRTLEGPMGMLQGLSRGNNGGVQARPLHKHHPPPPCSGAELLPSGENATTIWHLKAVVNVSIALVNNLVN